MLSMGDIPIHLTICKAGLCTYAELQIRGGIVDNSKIFFSFFSTKTYIVTPHLNRIVETVLMRAHNEYLKGKIRKSISKFHVSEFLGEK